MECAFDDDDARALERYMRKNRRVALLQVTENVKAGHDQNVRTITQTGYWSRAAVPQIGWEKVVIWSDESLVTLPSTSG